MPDIAPEQAATYLKLITESQEDLGLGRDQLTALAKMDAAA